MSLNSLMLDLLSSTRELLSCSLRAPGFTREVPSCSVDSLSSIGRAQNLNVDSLSSIGRARNLNVDSLSFIVEAPSLIDEPRNLNSNVLNLNQIRDLGAGRVIRTRGAGFRLVFLWPGFLEAFTELFRHRLQAGSGFGRSLHVLINLRRLLHRLTADGQARVIDFRAERVDQSLQLSQLRKQIDVLFKGRGVEAVRKDRRVVLRGAQAIIDKRNAVGSGFEQRLAFVGTQRHQEWKVSRHGSKGIFDCLHVGGA